MLLLTNHRMKDTLQPVQCPGIAGHGLPQRSSIHYARLHNPRELQFDPADRAPAAPLQPMNHRISVEDRDSGSSEYRRGGGLPHSNPAG